MIEQLLSELHKRYTAPIQPAKQPEQPPKFNNQPSIQPNVQASPEVKIDQSGRRYIPTIQALQMLEGKRQFNIGVAQDYSKRYGVPISPKDSLDNINTQIKGLKPLDVQEMENRQTKDNVNTLFDVWGNTGTAPSGLESYGINQGDPIYDKVAARETGGSKVSYDDIRKEVLSQAKDYQQNGYSAEKYIKEIILPEAENIISEGLDVNKVIDQVYYAFSNGQFPTRKDYFDKIKQQMKDQDPYDYEQKFNEFMKGQQLNFKVQSKGGGKTALDQHLKGSLKGYGSAFTAVGKKYGIDPNLLAAIAIHETGNGTSPAIKNKNNVGGMMGKNGLMTFGSIEEGIDAMASNLRRNYINQGLTTIPQIQRKYAPIGANNDPTGLNNHWISGVSKYYKNLSS